MNTAKITSSQALPNPTTSMIFVSKEGVGLDYRIPFPENRHVSDWWLSDWWRRDCNL